MPAVLEGEVGPYYVLAEDALRVDLLVYLVYLVGELSLPVLRLEGFCYLEDLV